MTKRLLFAVVGLGMMTWTVGCARENPVAPSDLNANVPVGTLSELTATSPVVTFEPDLTANPSLVTVRAWGTVLMVNNSPRLVRLHSYNCAEFSTIYLYPGQSRRTLPFYEAGTTCDYFAWDTGWSRKIFVGQVMVQ